jgi:hypothetical protein
MTVSYISGEVPGWGHDDKALNLHKLSNTWLLQKGTDVAQ